MACKIEIPFSSPASVAVQKAKSAVESQNGLFNGDENSGSFELGVFGNFIKGEYIISGQTLSLNILEKPLMLPCNMIEYFLKKEIS